MDEIIVKDLVVKGQLGPDGWSLGKSQIIILNIKCYSNFIDSDLISDTVSYSNIANHVQSFVERNKELLTLQQLAAKISADIIEMGVLLVRVKIEKTHSVLNAKSSGIETLRSARELEFCNALACPKPSSIPPAPSEPIDDFLFARDMNIYCIIGVNPCERVEKQLVIISYSLFFHPPNLPNIISVARKVTSWIEKSSYQTIEKMAIDCCSLIFHIDSCVSKIIIGIEKPSALRFASSSGVSITRVRTIQPAKEIQKSTTVFLGIGTNLGDRVGNIHNAIRLLNSIGVKVQETSFLYETAPMYITDQPLFLNAALKAETILEPLDLLGALKEIEEKLGRDFKTVKNGPRVIDLDILLYDSLVFNLEGLRIPHPALQDRLFVLEPLNDIASDIYHPLLFRPISQLLELHHLFLSSSEKNESFERVFPINRNILWKLEKKTYLMAILNATSNSFSFDGTTSIDAAVEVFKRFVSEGADIVDIGGQSTAPNAPEISMEEEIQNVVPLIRAIRKFDSRTPISVDTFRAAVANAAILAGADLINDVSGGCRDPEMRKIMSKLEVPVCLMHMRGNSQTMQSMTVYDDSVVQVVKDELKERTNKAIEAGICKWNIVIDPGIGFAKVHIQNYKILKRLEILKDLDYPILIGVSRKSFLGNTTGEKVAAKRTISTAAANAAAIVSGAAIIRIHDVKEMKQVCQVIDELKNC